jgi:asparagine synthase (glutamine-hydrolysing)
MIKALPDSRDSKAMEYIRRLKKFFRSTKGSFPERILALKEIFPQEIRHTILLKSKNNQIGSDNDLALKWVQKLVGYYHGDRINSILYADLIDSLPGDMLTKVDWMSMKNSLEVRVPFLDHRVVELSFQMHSKLKLHKGKTKYILKETFRNILPSRLYHRPKAGFEVPISRWLKSELKFLIEKHLSKVKISDQGIFDHLVIQNLIEKHLSGKTDTSWMLWNLIVFNSWFESHFL